MWHIHNNKTLHNIESEHITTTHNMNEFHKQYWVKDTIHQILHSVWFFYFTFIIGRLMHKARSQGNGPLKGERTGCAGGEGSKVVAVFYFLTNTECSWRSSLNILNFTFEMDCVYPKRSLWWLSNKKSNVHFTCYVINALRAVIVTAIIISVILCIQ